MIIFIFLNFFVLSCLSPPVGEQVVEEGGNFVQHQDPKQICVLRRHPKLHHPGSSIIH